MSRILSLFIKGFNSLKEFFSSGYFFLGENVLCIYRCFFPSIFLRTFLFPGFLSFDFFSEIKQYFSSHFFYSEIRINGFNKNIGFYIRQLKGMKRFGIFHFRLVNPEMTPEMFINQFYRFWLCLFERTFFIIAWAYSAFRWLDSFHNPKISIAIHNSRNISEISFSHTIDYTLFREKIK